MSLYNLLHGRNPETPALLEVIRLSDSKIERLRDVGLDKKLGFIWVLARTGGPNRPSYSNADLVNNPHYLKDHDEKFDSTFAIYYFNVPEGTDTSKFTHSDIPDLKKKTDAAIENMEKGNINKGTQEFMDSIGAQITRNMMRK